MKLDIDAAFAESSRLSRLFSDAPVPAKHLSTSRLSLARSLNTPIYPLLGRRCFMFSSHRYLRLPLLSPLLQQQLRRRGGRKTKRETMLWRVIRRRRRRRIFCKDTAVALHCQLGVASSSVKGNKALLSLVTLNWPHQKRFTTHRLSQRDWPSPDNRCSEWTGRVEVAVMSDFSKNDQLHFCPPRGKKRKAQPFETCGLKTAQPKLPQLLVNQLIFEAPRWPPCVLLSRIPGVPENRSKLNSSSASQLFQQRLPPLGGASLQPPLGGWGLPPTRVAALKIAPGLYTTFKGLGLVSDSVAFLLGLVVGKNKDTEFKSC